MNWAAALQTIYVVMGFVFAAIFYLMWREKKQVSTLLSAVIVGWSSLIYLNHYFQIIDLTQMYYVDWIVTTPLLVLSLSYVIRGKITPAAVVAAFLQAGVITTGFLAYKYYTVATEWFLVGILLLIGVFYNIYSFAKGRIGVYAPFLVILFATWIAYPIVWYAYDGLLINAAIPLTIIPFISKHVFTFLKEVVYSR